MIASLPMYDRAETRPALDRLWDLVRNTAEHRLPAKLTHGGDPWEHWQNPDLVLSQSCSLPYRTRLSDIVELIGTPVHDLDCKAGRYYSVLVARRADSRRELTDFDSARFAVNEYSSQSGWAALSELVEKEGIQATEIQLSGTHAASAQLVAAGEADLAALDAVSWQLMCRYDDFSRDLKVITTSPPTPALPFIASRTSAGKVRFEAFQTAIAKLSPEDRETLCLQGLTRVDPQEYLALPVPQMPA